MEAGARWPGGFHIEASPGDARTALTVTGGDPRSGVGKTIRYVLADRSHDAFADLFAAVAADFGARIPHCRAPASPSGSAPLQPLLTEPLSPKILYGYGDPCVMREARAAEPPLWWLTATSNDAPDAFPILYSADLRRWEPAGFVFPQGEAPHWTLQGLGAADFWAPEMHRVGEEVWLCFCARQKDGTLAIGIAKAAGPQGPYGPPDAPLLTGRVIDPHIFAGRDGTLQLFWKEDSNGVWPALLVALLHGRPELADRLFTTAADRRTAALAAAMWPWTRELPPMQRFCAQQVLIEAATSDFAGFRRRLAEHAAAEPGLAIAVKPILEAMTTRVLAQPLAPDASRLIGSPTLVLQNDQPWEAHLIEGMWVTEQAGRFYMLYSGNDFSTAHYGIGAAVAEHPLGPWRKTGAPLLQSTADWWGPGHPSVATGPDGRPRLFLHAFFPHRMGYKAFRALLMAEIAFDSAGVRLLQPH